MTCCGAGLLLAALPGRLTYMEQPRLADADRPSADAGVSLNQAPRSRCLGSERRISPPRKGEISVPGLGTAVLSPCFG